MLAENLTQTDEYLVATKLFFDARPHNCSSCGVLTQRNCVLGFAGQTRVR